MKYIAIILTFLCQLSFANCIWPAEFSDDLEFISKIKDCEVSVLTENVEIKRLYVLFNNGQGALHRLWQEYLEAHNVDVEKQGRALAALLKSSLRAADPQFYDLLVNISIKKDTLALFESQRLEINQELKEKLELDMEDYESYSENLSETLASISKLERELEEYRIQLKYISPQVKSRFHFLINRIQEIQ